ncbi:DUF2235 domain-containing protein [Stieleria varia]|nr:DUF2235 domain-containing protein [Stieleria varia]
MTDQPTDGDRNQPKTIVVCCDGTGNVGGAVTPTNVWRIREAVYQGIPKRDDRVQVVLYQDGVGTSRFRPLEILGKAISFGLTANLESLYSRFIQVYQPGDRVYLFGFSRGAYTVRMFSDLLYRCGVASCRHHTGRLLRNDEIDDLATRAVEAYKHRHVKDASGRSLAELFRLRAGISKSADGEPSYQPPATFEDRENEPAAPEKGRIPIEFVGVWDTVASVGFPFDNVNQRLMSFWQRVVRKPGLRWATFAQLNWHRDGHWTQWRDDDLNPLTRNAFHAIAVDDERQAFRPILWTEFDKPDASVATDDDLDQTRPPVGTRKKNVNVQQVWFAGMHANVGGGYAKDDLAYVSLKWMMDRAEEAGLVFEANTRRRYEDNADPLSQIADSRSGLALYYRYKPRSVEKLSAQVGLTYQNDERKPKIHTSVLQRIENGTDQYAPIGLPSPDHYVEVDEAAGTLEQQIRAQTTTQIEDSFFRDPTLRGSVPTASSTEYRWKQRSRPEEEVTRSTLQKSTASETLRDESTAVDPACPEETRRQALRITYGYTRIRRGLYYAFFTLTIAFLVVGVTSKRPGLLAPIDNFFYHGVARVTDAFHEINPLGPIPLIVLTPPLIALAVISYRSRKRVLAQDELDDQLTELADPNPIRTIFLNAAGFMILALILRPLAHWVTTALIPVAGEQLVGVLGSPTCFAIFAALFYGVIKLNAFCRNRMRLWSVYAWRVSQRIIVRKELSPDRYDRFAGRFTERSPWIKFFDHIVVPTVAFSILSVALAFPIWITIRDIVLRMRIQSADATSVSMADIPAGIQGIESKAFQLSFVTSDILDTELTVDPRVMYVLAIQRGLTEETQWKDRTQPIDADGVIAPENLNALQRLSTPLKRNPAAAYFQLVASVDDPAEMPFVITPGIPFSVPRRGRLYLSVNDVPGFYFNNQGTATVWIWPLAKSTEHQTP